MRYNRGPRRAHEPLDSRSRVRCDWLPAPSNRSPAASRSCKSGIHLHGTGGRQRADGADRDRRAEPRGVAGLRRGSRLEDRGSRKHVRAHDRIRVGRNGPRRHCTRMGRNGPRDRCSGTRMGRHDQRRTCPGPRLGRRECASQRFGPGLGSHCRHSPGRISDAGTGMGSGRVDAPGCCRTCVDPGLIRQPGRRALLLGPCRRSAARKHRPRCRGRSRPARHRRS